MLSVAIQNIHTIRADGLNLVPLGNQIELTATITHSAVKESSSLAKTQTSLSISRKDGNQTEPLNITLEIEGVFTITGTPSDDVIRQETQAIVFPYIQANVASLCSIIGIPAIVLPTTLIA